MIMKTIWFKNEREYNELVESILNHENDIALNILSQIIMRGDL